MKFIFTVISFLLFSSTTFSQIQILSNLNAEIDKYEFYIFKGMPCSVILDENGKEIKDQFILNDPKTIKHIIKNWKGKRADSYYKCGYDYNIYVVLEGKIVETIQFNSEVKQAFSSSGGFDVQENPFKNLNQNITFSEYEFETNDLENARAFLKESKNKDGVFIPHIKRYNWVDFDGRFFVQIVRGKNQKKLKSTKFYESEMHKIYKEDKFLVAFWGWGDTYEMWIYSNEDFWKKFNLYSRKGEFEKIESSYRIYLFGNSLELEKLIRNNK